MYLRTIFEAADTSGDGEISVAEAIKAVRNDDDFAELMGFGQRTKGDLGVLRRLHAVEATRFQE